MHRRRLRRAGRHRNHDVHHDQPRLFLDGGASERRRLLGELVGAVYDTAQQNAVAARPVERWAIESAGRLASPDASEWPWPDLDRETLRWSQSDEGAWCAIVDDPAWADASTGDPRDMFRRPLLPHEDTCDDVFEWRVDLGGLRRLSELVDAVASPNP